MLITRALPVVVMAVAALMAGCGSGNGESSSTKSSGGQTSALTRTQYKQRLKAVAAQASAAQLSVQKATHASSVGDLRRGLSGFVAQQRAIGQELGALRPPADAADANRQLAKGFADNATATEQALTSIEHASSVRSALSALSRSRAAERSGHEIDDALSRLKKLGYTKGS